MQAFTNTTMTKDELLTELKIHQEADNFVKGKYFRDGKGCAVGCSLESLKRKKKLPYIQFEDHSAFEVHFGIPEWLAKVEDRIFEGVSKKRSKKWPVEFIAAIKVGTNLNKIKPLFLIMVLEDTLGSFDHLRFPKTKTAVDLVISLYKKGEKNIEEFIRARNMSLQARNEDAAAAAAADAAAAAADAAAAAAAAAAYGTDSYTYAAAAADAAADAAAAAAAAYGTDSYTYAAAAAAYGTDSYCYAYASNDEACISARYKKFEIFADNLLNIMRNIK